MSMFLMNLSAVSVVLSLRIAPEETNERRSSLPIQTSMTGAALSTSGSQLPFAVPLGWVQQTQRSNSFGSQQFRFLIMSLTALAHPGQRGFACLHVTRCPVET